MVRFKVRSFESRKPPKIDSTWSGEDCELGSCQGGELWWRHHLLQGFITIPRWLFGISEPSTVTWILRECSTNWWFQIFFMFIPIWGNDPIWLNIFQMGWKPPTRSPFSLVHHHLLFFWFPSTQLANLRYHGNPHPSFFRILWGCFQTYFPRPNYWNRKSSSWMAQ